jgi:hypothetical protein
MSKHYTIVERLHGVNPYGSDKMTDADIRQELTRYFSCFDIKPQITVKEARQLMKMSAFSIPADCFLVKVTMHGRFLQLIAWPSETSEAA